MEEVLLFYNGLYCFINSDFITFVFVMPQTVFAS